MQKISHNGFDYIIDETLKELMPISVAYNDGLTFTDFWSWFKNCPENLGCIIHFTDFRY